MAGGNEADQEFDYCGDSEPTKAPCRYNDEAGPDYPVAVFKRQRRASGLSRNGTRLDITEEFILKHTERERQRDKDREDEAAQLAATVKSADRKFKRFIACWSLALAIFMALIALWDHWAAVRHVLLAPPAVVSQSQPETSTVPPQ